MSEENVKFVLDRYERFNSGERAPDLGYWDPEGEYHAAREDPDSAVHRGIEALTRHFASWFAAYPDLKVEPIDAEGSGGVVFLWVRFSGHGAASGAPMEMELAHVITLRDGRVLRTVEYFDRVEARDAAGLPAV